MAVLVIIAIGYGFKQVKDFNELKKELDHMESRAYREQVCREVLIENRKLKGFS
ncbi:hypothetical protein [Streptococcus ovis]|uniref:hypothetical protein n=1 Tax=Streptococcus ovis TaxID=82806 RepID=UPI0012EA221C|nr:hypothetical protein [Streptococcus ovis]